MVRNFNDFLREQRGGETSVELASALAELTEAVATNDKKGTLTLTITIEPMKGSRGGQVIVRDDIKLKKPMMARGATLFFTTPENHLQRNDPRQVELPGIREVPSPGVDSAKDVPQGVANA